jgi:phosphate transport system protein
VQTSSTSDVNPRRDLALVESLVVEMFGTVADAVVTASAAFLAGDREVARRVVANDRHVDDLLATVEAIAESRLIDDDGLSREDRSLLVYVLRTAPELERSADLIEHIALRTPQGLVALLPGAAQDLLSTMAGLASSMWRLAADGFVLRDPTVGSALQVEDAELDDLHVELTETLADSGCSPAVAIEMGLIGRFYERLGDHAVNVAHRVSGLTRQY